MQSWWPTEGQCRGGAHGEVGGVRKVQQPRVVLLGARRDALGARVRLDPLARDALRHARGPEVPRRAHHGAQLARAALLKNQLQHLRERVDAGGGGYRFFVSRCQWGALESVQNREAEGNTLYQKEQQSNKRRTVGSFVVVAGEVSLKKKMTGDGRREDKKNGWEGNNILFA